MDRADPQEDDDGADAAERAFEGLREEVAALRRGIELVYRRLGQAGAEAPDYSPTLGEIAKELKACGERLGRIEAHPALLLTPAGFRVELKHAVEGAAAAAGLALRETTQRAEAATRKLEDLVGRARKREEQRAWLWTIGVFGVALGLALWLLVPALLRGVDGVLGGRRRPVAGRAGDDAERRPGSVEPDGAARKCLPQRHLDGSVRGGDGSAASTCIGCLGGSKDARVRPGVTARQSRTLNRSAIRKVLQTI